jgi:uncharacterized membrane protein
MLAAIWTEPNFAEVLFLISAIVATILTVIMLLKDPVSALLPAAVACIAFGFLAL